MADLEIGPVRPSDGSVHSGIPTPEPFGPDPSQTPPAGKEPPKVNQKTPPKSTTNVFSKLGQNRKLRSPVRKLSREPLKDDELSDLERLEGWYHAIGNMARIFHPKFAEAMHMQARECAIAWFGLAENNDTVRRYILMFIEGGDWGKVFAAHAPIFMAVIPQSVLERFFLKGMGAFAANFGQTQDMSEMNDAFAAMQNMFGQPDGQE